MRTVTLAAVVLGTVLGIGGTARADADPTGDTFGSGSIDVSDLSACQSATTLVVRLTFAGPISPPSGTPGNPAELYGKKDKLTIECAGGARAQLSDVSARLDRALDGG